MVDNNTALMATPQRTTIAQMEGEFAALHALKSAIMRRGTDYGTIPGCGDKPALFKPGAEKVLKTFLVHVTDVQVEDLSTADCIRYRVRCIGQTPEGVTRGVGIGECSTDEDKYKWRRAVCDEEYEDTPASRRREVYKRKRNGHYTMKQVRTQPADLANTVLKMAKKRAMVDLALTATAASDFFTQDIEDLDPELRAQVARERERPADPFAPPPVGVDAEVVDEPPPRLSPKRQVWERAKELGLTGDDVKAAIDTTGAPQDARRWTVNDVAIICEGLAERARGAATATNEPTGDDAPPVDQNPVYAELLRLCEANGHGQEALDAAMAECGYTPETLTDTGLDEVLTAIERAKGV